MAGRQHILAGIARVAWRLLHKSPPLSQAMPAWQKLASQITHVALYGFMLAAPVSGSG